MIMSLKECLARVSAFEDSQELADAIRSLKDEVSKMDAYYLEEAAINLEGMHALLRSLAHHASKVTP